MQPPAVTAELVERLEAAVDAFGVARVEALAELPGNPLGLELARFGDVFAPAATAAPDLDFVNRITGLGPDDTGRLEEILSFYAERGLRPWLEVTPGVELDLPAGTAIVGFQSFFYGPARPAEPTVAVREADDGAATSRLLLEAFDVPADLVERHGGALAQATARSEGRLFAIDVDGRPVAAGILTVRDRTGYLAMAGTLADFRGRGFQHALIAARIAAAAAAGCDLVVATAEFGSVSHRNIERGGLRLAYTKPVLRLTPPGARDPGATA